MATDGGDIDDYAGDSQDNKYDGVGAHPEVDGVTMQDIKAGIRIEYPWKTGTGAPASSGYALGQPD